MQLQAAVLTRPRKTTASPEIFLMTFGGESLLYPDAVFSIMNKAAACEIPVRQLITNGGTWLDEHSLALLAEKIIGCGVTEVLLSVDSFHKEFISLKKQHMFAAALVSRGFKSISLSPAWVTSKDSDNMGFSKSEINRKIYDFDAMAKGVENYLSISEMAVMFDRIYRGQMISEKASRDMTEVMSKNQRTDVIPYCFSETVKVAHISGLDDDALVDCGTVYCDHPFILAMASAHTDRRKVEAMMRDVTTLCFRDASGESL